MDYPRSFDELVDALRKLPGVGLKSAERMAFQILEMPDFSVKEISNALINAKEKLHHCSICGQLCEDDICSICSNDLRDKSIICVVENPKDVFAIDKTGEYNGLFHVLYGRISPVNGIGPSDLNLDSLIERVKGGFVKEVIVATNPNIEGETTAMYLSKLLKSYDVRVTRIAYGMPLGSNIDYADEFTIVKSFEGRKQI